MVLKWNGARLHQQVKWTRTTNGGFIQSSPMYAVYQKFANAMNTALDQNKERSNVEMPKAKTTEEAKVSHPVAPF